MPASEVAAPFWETRVAAKVTAAFFAISLAVLNLLGIAAWLLNQL
jgi:hypothetical protein